MLAAGLLLLLLWGLAAAAAAAAGGGGGGGVAASVADCCWGLLLLLLLLLSSSSGASLVGRGGRGISCNTHKQKASNCSSKPRVRSLALLNAHLSAPAAHVCMHRWIRGGGAAATVRDCSGSSDGGAALPCLARPAAVRRTRCV